MIMKAEPADCGAVADLALRLWPGNALDALEREFREILRDGEAAVFLFRDGAGPVAFAQCGLRHDYVEGADSRPAGYLEGIYVAPSHRRRGIARSLLGACEAWARRMGCRAFASDCELENAESLAFHRSAGFAEANRIVCFVKKL